MEKLVGETLSARIAREGKMAIAESCKLIAEVAEGLGAAHDKGIVHRDIKPDNVFLAKIAGEIVVKVVDFGIAKNIQRSGTMDTLTQVGTIVGTPITWRPSKPRAVAILDARVDIYACGVMLYEMLTGQRPFASKNTYELLSLVIRSTPTPPRAHREDIPLDLERVILVAMRKDRKDRFATARDLSKALREIARSGVVSASTGTSLPMPTGPALPSELATRAQRVVPVVDPMRTIEDPRKPDDE